MVFRIVVTCLVMFSLILPLAAQSSWPQTFVDATGYNLRLSHKPKAIVSLTLATDELLFDLVERSRLAGITYLSTDQGISNIATAARGFPQRLSGEKERIIALQPDLILVADWKEKEFIQSLRDVGLPVFVFHAPVDFPELRSAIRVLAGLCGEPTRGETMIRGIDQRLKAVADRCRTIDSARRLSVLSYSFFGTTYGKGTSFDALTVAAGLINSASQHGMKGWPQVSKEQVLALDPDIILLPTWSFEGKVNASDFKAAFLRDPIFASLRAVKTRRVLNLPDAHLVANSQYMVDAVEDLAHAAYPELLW